MARQAHAGDHIDLVEARPLAVRRLKEIHVVEDAQVVDQDVGARFSGEQCRGTLRRTQICHPPAQVSRRDRLANACQGGIDLARFTPDHHHGCAGRCQRLADAQANACGTAADDGYFAAHIDVHIRLLKLKWQRRTGRDQAGIAQRLPEGRRNLL